jgi:hypothetical protein
VHGKKCASFQHGWCSSCWTARSLEENWRIPRYFLLIDRPMCSAAYAQLARQTLALCALGVQPKMRPGVYVCRQPRQRGVAAYPQLAGTLKSLMATCGGAKRSQLRASARGAVKVLIPLIKGTPWVGCCTRTQGVGRACARGRQTCFEEGSPRARESVY